MAHTYVRGLDFYRSYLYCRILRVFLQPFPGVSRFHVKAIPFRRGSGLKKYGMRRFRQLGFEVVLLLLTTTSLASQLAVLRNGFSIRHERHTLVGAVTRLYTGSDTTSYVEIPNAEIDHFEIDTPPPPPPLAPPSPPASPMSIDLIVDRASGTHKMDSDLINSVIKAESGFNIRAVSPKGAQGLM